MKNSAVALISLLLISGCKNDARFDFACGIEAKDQYPIQEDSLYILPWTTGETYKVGQGNCTTGSHNSQSLNQFAYDFLMPIGTTIRAARSGTVNYVEEGYSDDDHNTNGNLVAISHSDGSLAMYGHLTTLGALVEVGQQINQGDVIAMSGNSGNSSGPHLHFEVASCIPGESDCDPKSIPITFRNTRPHSNGLMQGESYTAQ